ncbi:MAG TPA: hydrogenase maturation protease [Azospira sp.]|nr:hydrogenase maturation protease [Azospira sp.]
MTAPFVILACGNPSRGDDALGPLLLDRLGGWLAAEGIADRFELIEDFQFQVEHALDLQGRQAALFIDAGTDTPAPYVLHAQLADDTPGHSTHAISPGAVLAVYRRVVGSEPPPASVLCVRGECFDLGAGLSAAATVHLEAAWRQLQVFCHGLLQSPAGSGKA